MPLLKVRAREEHLQAILVSLSRRSGLPQHQNAAVRRTRAAVERHARFLAADGWQ
jgi:hypothetical protein